jgi:hypothetical protein
MIHGICDLRVYRLFDNSANATTIHLIPITPQVLLNKDIVFEANLKNKEIREMLFNDVTRAS